jgi:FkbM family methyltransferase
LFLTGMSKQGDRHRSRSGVVTFRPATELSEKVAVCLYGAGSTGRRVFETLLAAGWDIRCFLDAAADRLEEISGVPVLTPFPNPLGEEDRHLPVIITIFNRDVDTVAVARRLSEEGYGPIVSYMDLHARFRNALGDHFWLGDPEIVERDSQRIDAVEGLWTDERSRRIFHSLVALYRSRDPQSAPQPSVRDEEYVAPDIPGWLPVKSLRVIDCGAYDGDTLEHLRNAKFLIEAAACFEPDLENFRRLSERVSSWVAAERRGITLWPCGVSQRTGTVAFNSGMGESSRLADGTAGATVTCVALDEVLPGFAPNLIKLDVEGAEEIALRGAERMIHANRPGLAISVYHRPADLWRLPALVNEWNLGYRFFLRSYGFNGFDTVCYAIPPS